ncbi:helix-turn-helix transcriptional regulator [Sediminibacillus terrae]|uniref:helix-turn-helix transcriptional regulator n=1 Tax=Sediminibacillus terrae TaxID=1562106 RepID=UPI001296A6A0|nr:helix-turn-helix transcriptional regulator [Sediminibacillus terrae]
MNINSKVREIRKSKGITQVFVAKQLGIAVQTYNGYELGRREIKAETLRNIASILNEPVENFFDNNLYDSKKNESKEAI